MTPFGLVVLAATVFTATNVDDLFVLLMFLSDKRFTTRQVVVGQYVGVGLLVLISAVGSLVSLVVPSEWIGLLGLLPLGIGLKQLADLRRADSGDESEEEKPLQGRRSNVLAVAAVTFANGGDNLGVYIPLFSTQRSWEVGIMVAVFLVLVAVWFAIARFLLTHQRFGNVVRRYGHVMLPLVLIGLGLWILSHALPLVQKVTS